MLATAVDRLARWRGWYNEAMSRLYKTEGVVLRPSYMGEADALLTLCTPDRGKLRAVARGVRRPKSRLAGHWNRSPTAP